MIRSLAALAARVRTLPKMERFFVYLGLAALLAASGSALTYGTYLRKPAATPVTIAVIAPMSGPDAALGAAMRQGAEELALLRSANQKLRPVDIAVFDSNQPDAIERAANAPDVVAVIGPVAADPSDEAKFAAKRLTQITLSGPTKAADAWSKPLSADSEYEARFLANYVRNVLGEKLVSIILPEGEAWAAVANAFDETLQRFGTKVVYRWTIPADRAPALNASAQEIVSKPVVGSLLVLGSPEFAAEALADLAAAKVSNRVIGLRDFGTTAFHTALAKNWHAQASLSSALNQAVFATPVLFDTAGATAQAFRDAFEQSNHTTPDWAAVLAYDAANAVTTAMDALDRPADQSGKDLRAAVHDELARHGSVETALPGLAAPIFFGGRSGSAVPTLMGRFDGQNIVAAETQLSPIRDEGVSNYLEQLANGRVLYVNDRFMYKTNVVAAGIRVNKVIDPQPDTNTVDLDFTLWFRWRGSLAANDIVFENAVQPIVLGNAERSLDDGDLHYRAWHVRGKFFLNVSALPHPYGTQMVSINFRHRVLARNNLTYVADVVGMNLVEGPRHDATPTGLLARLLHLKQDGGSALTTQLRDDRAMVSAQGWLADKALISQDMLATSSEGDPSYVGFGKPQPVFSHIAMDVQIKPDAFDLRGLLPQSVMIYLAIFGAIFAGLAHLLDRKDRGQFWRMQTLVLRLISWPLLLATISSLALDYTVANADITEVQAVDFLAKALWWVVPARLVSLVVDRFIWAPLEARTQRKIPTVFRMTVSVLIYMLAGFGVVSFVLGKPITSLLATSGLITLIFGLAVQSNLKDIFSGVMLNLEQPFRIGDWVRINRIEAQVHDISWRTTRLRTRHGQIVAMANGKVADAEVENLTAAGLYFAPNNLYMDPRVEPELVVAACHKAVEQVAKKYSFRIFKIILARVENINGGWAARYRIDLLVDDMHVRAKVNDMLWPLLWTEIKAAGLLWALTPHLTALNTNESERSDMVHISATSDR